MKAIPRNGNLYRLTISASAREEATRLRTQSLGIEPTELTTELVGRLTRIDGALLIDPKGICHAAGVILDGQATEHGDPSRGVFIDVFYLVQENRKVRIGPEANALIH